MSESPAQASQYVGRLDLRVRNNSHTIAYYAIAERARDRRCRVLDIGCSTGYFGEAVRALGHEVWGIEISERAAALAEGRLDRVMVGRVEDVLPAIPAHETRFDFITLGDVLEHLADPAAVLRACRALLAEGGTLIASVPNVAHAAVRVMLLEGRWQYDELGILDRTHLRFFTRRSLIELFGECAYAVESVVPVRLPPALTGIAFDPALLEAVSTYLEDDAADIFQFVVTAVDGRDATRAAASNARFLPEGRPAVLVMMPLADWSLGDIRLKRPLAAWSEQFGGEVRVRWTGGYTQRDLDWADIVVLQRESSPAVLDLIDRIHELGKRVVFDIDDLLTDVPEFLIVHQHCQTMRPFLIGALRSVDAVTVTTERLRQRLCAYRESIDVVPNCAGPIGVRARHHLERGPVTLIVASTDTIRTDFIVPALRRVLDDPELDARIVAIGPPGQFLAAAGIAAACIGNLDYDGFRQFVAGHDDAIAIVPLDDSVFSSCKSAVKYLDYAMAGVVAVCSRVPPYTDTVVDGETGVLVDNDPAHWYEAIRSLATNPQLRAAISDRALRACERDHSMRVAARAWDELIGRVEHAEIAAAPAGARVRPPPPGIRDWVRLLRQPAAYRSGLRILAREGIGGLTHRIGRLYR